MLNDDICIRLKLYGEDIKHLLKENSWQETKNKENADIIFINTCAFLKRVEDRAILSIKRVIKNKKESQEVAVFGCLPSINLKRLRGVHNGAIFSGRYLNKIIETFGLKECKTKISHVVKRKPKFLTLFNRYINRIVFRDDYFTYLYDKKKVFHLKISEGCLGKCSFCSEKSARGCLKSKKVKDILKEFKSGLKKGYRIFSLNADDTSVFGIDNSESIIMLLEKILKQKNDFRLVITEFNPFGLLKYPKKLLSLLSSRKIVFITVPIQSGNQRILKMMNRPYKIDEVIQILSAIRKNNPKIRINTHLIAGFPGETKQEFQDTYDLLDKFHFNKVKVFKYSSRAGTPASLMRGKINEKEKEARRKSLYRKVIWGCIKSFNLKELLLNTIYFF